MKLPSALLVLVSRLLRLSVAHLVSLKFPGYGFLWYDPACAFACSNAISGATLSCTTTAETLSGMSMSVSATTSPECLASNTAYLTTLAYCINAHCDPAAVPTWQRERFWASQVTGDSSLAPKWYYLEALERIKGTPSVEYNSSSTTPMNQTMLVPEANYDEQYKFNIMFDYIESLQARYCFVLVTVGFGTPILFTLLARLSLLSAAIGKAKPYLVYPSVFGTYHIRPLPWLSGNAPTIGQALYIAMFFFLNLVLSAVNYRSQQPHPWGFPPKEERLAYIGYRTGHIAYALLPLLILFSGRNNFLLWVTNWSHSTFIVLHRWVARIFAVQAIVHSITLLLTYQGTGSYLVESKKAYWLWGIVATVLTCAMLVLSHLRFRRRSYEVFLALHIVLSILVIVGCWYHVVLMWGMNFYTDWLFAACAVWFFDRLLRFIRVAKNGIRHATVREIGSGYVRVDIPGIRWASKPGHVVYVHFPMLTPMRPWENHPFSANSMALFHNYKHELLPTHGSASSQNLCSSDDARGDIKPMSKVPTTGVAHLAAANASLELPAGGNGLTLVIKKNTGVTKQLKSHDRMLTLVDGPYANQSSRDVMESDRIILIGGGVGITGLLGWIHAHPNIRLAWSVSSGSEALVEEMDVALGGVADKQVVVGERLDIDALLKSEAQAGYGKVGVVVCGPAEMCDVVRAKVSAHGRAGKTIFELEVDAFSL